MLDMIGYRRFVVFCMLYCVGICFEVEEARSYQGPSMYFLRTICDNMVFKSALKTLLIIIITIISSFFFKLRNFHPILLQFIYKNNIQGFFRPYFSLHFNVKYLEVTPARVHY